jgi:hypothetical protein
MEPGMRELYSEILEYKGLKLYEEVLMPWVIENEYQEYLLGYFSEITEAESLEISQDDKWELYALSKVLDVLTLRLQVDNKVGGEWPGPELSLSEYIDFNELLGLSTGMPKTFHPSDCEIVEAQPGDDDFRVTKHFFPSSRLDNLIIKRAGVGITLSAQQYDLSIANSAVLYWASWRKNRKRKDLSDGWGSNSRWRTDARLDFEAEDRVIYNVGGELNLNSVTAELISELAKWDLTVEDAIELTKFRHFVKSTKDDSDLFPYYFRYEEKKY